MQKQQMIWPWVKSTGGRPWFKNPRGPSFSLGLSQKLRENPSLAAFEGNPSAGLALGFQRIPIFVASLAVRSRLNCRKSLALGDGIPKSLDFSQKSLPFPMGQVLQSISGCVQSVFKTRNLFKTSCRYGFGSQKGYLHTLLALLEKREMNKNCVSLSSH